MLQPWRDFFALTGTASATLVGLMFVAVSLGTGVFTQERQVGLRSFLTPTVVAFATVLATSLLGMLPVSDPRVLASLGGGIGALGMAYVATVWRRLLRHGIARSDDREDRVWYIVAPALAYAALAAGSAACVLAPRASFAKPHSLHGMREHPPVRHTFSPTNVARWLTSEQRTGQVSESGRKAIPTVAPSPAN